MPIYEYKCKDCETHFEKLQKSSDEPLKVCSQCGGELEKQWSLSGFQFKGEGWYVTDYAAKKVDPKAEKGEKSEKSEKSEGSEKKSTTESTAGSESASKKTSDSKKDSKKDSGKKD